MAIKPPNHAKNAIPTKRGWEHPRTGELLIARRHTQSQIDEYLGVTIAPPPAPQPVEPIEVDEDNPEFDIEDPTEELVTDEVDFEEMTKRELEEVGREHGIELDRREKKTTLIERLKSVIK